jgi:hypothetical protein
MSRTRSSNGGGGAIKYKDKSGEEAFCTFTITKIEDEAWRFYQPFKKQWYLYVPRALSFSHIYVSSRM